MKHILEFKLFTGVTQSNPYHGNEWIRQYSVSNDEFVEQGYTDDDWNNIINILERDCKNFLDEITKYEIDPLWRGSPNLGDIAHKGIWKKRARTNRVPKDMDPVVSSEFDKSFYKKFGYKLRSEGVFACKSPASAAGYGKFKEVRLANQSTRSRFQPHLFFPIGDFKCFWNPDIDDLFSVIEYEPWYAGDYNDDVLYDEWAYKYGDPRYSFNSGRRKGHFIFNDVPIYLNSIDKVKKAILENPFAYGLKSNGIGGYVNDKGQVLIHNTTSINNIKLIWVPEVSFDDYASDHNGSDAYGSNQNEIDSIVKGYREGDLKDVDKNEITFICKEYYLVDESFYPKLIEYIKSKSNK